MTANLIMRLVWVLSISPDVISRNIRPELFALIVGFVEIFRRSVWNFLRYLTLTLGEIYLELKKSILQMLVILRLFLI